MRQGELFALAWSDIDFSSASIMIQRSLEELKGKLRIKETKSARGRRRVDLPQFAVVALQDHRERMLAEGNIRGPAFCDRDGGYLRRPNVYRRSFLPAIARANRVVTRIEAASGAGLGGTAPANSLEGTIIHLAGATVTVRAGEEQHELHPHRPRSHHAGR
jgi:integrase